jgi:hypothetical protein
MAKRKTTSRPARTPIGPVAPPPIIGRLQNSGIMRFGEGQVPPAVNIAARVRKPTGRKAASSPPHPTAVPTKTSGMTRMGDMLSQSPADIAAMMQRPTSPKTASKNGRRR